MTFYGEEIGSNPTFSQVANYIAEKGLYIEPQQVMDYWGKKNWCKKNGKPVKTLEASINVANGLYIQNKLSKKGKGEQREKIKNEIRSKRHKAIEIAKENKIPQPFEEYGKQLEDEKWIHFRNFIFNVRGRKCEICGCKNMLQVHHTHYNKGAKAWEYTCNDVIVVCRDCHRKIHNII